MRRVVFAAIPPVQIVDLTAPYEVFARAGGYHVELVSPDPRGCIGSSCGLTLSGAADYRGIKGPIDTLMVPGGDGAEELLCGRHFLRWLRSTGARARRVGSICTGAFLLAAAGLLDGRRAVTHWDWCGRLSAQFPKVTVDPEPIFIKDGNVYTSAGVTAGLDLALALVEEDLGPAAALKIARDLVMFVRRPGGQSQFSTVLSAQISARRPIEDLHGWILDHLTGDLSVEALAHQCRMSPRHFARVFTAEKGITPARFVEQVRVEAAKLLLDSSDYGLKEAAERSGFGSADSMRRSFRRSGADARVRGVPPGPPVK
jgi:transcriptional regulator GlxA family with amidase domain